MTLTDIPAVQTELTSEPLPPYSGRATTCVKCSYPEAFTKFRPATRRIREEYNGETISRGPLPERLERSCGECDFQWDEALAPADAPQLRPATVGELAHAIQQCSPYPVHPQAAEHAATRMQEVLHTAVRTDHAMWAPAPPAPVRAPVLVPTDDQPTRQMPLVSSGVPVIIPERVDRPGPTGPVSPVSQLGSPGFAKAAEG
ncbi:hypothetical protein OV450_1432 [Actinobacteria bacterium OV450]|nr:hypothetical protein OV450_1432 [Actinobacteria bacterium OV450]